jgi:hypothetical protein
MISMSASSLPWFTPRSCLQASTSKHNLISADISDCKLSDARNLKNDREKKRKTPMITQFAPSPPQQKRAVLDVPQAVIVHPI